MTDVPFKDRRGGPREGSGRKIKVGGAYTPIVEKYILADGSAPLPEKLTKKEFQLSSHTSGKGSLADSSPKFFLESVDLVPTASELKQLALGTLKQVMERSPSDQARVGAAREVLTRADLETAPHGKKASQKARASEVAMEGGKFSPPSQPASAAKAAVN